MIDIKDRIKLVITAEVTGSACNFDCNYCYRKAQSNYEKNIKPTFNYSVEHMLKAFSRERIGGTAYVCVIGGGETLLPNEVVPFIKGLLAEGHVVELVTNLSLKNRVDELLEIPKKDLKHLLVKASFHYLELKRLNKLDTYFDNIKRLVEAGASAYPLITIFDEYLPILDEIKELCLKKLGELPHLASALKDFDKTMEPCDFYTPEFAEIIKEKFDSGIFKAFDDLMPIKPCEHFCYAGERTLVVNLNNGEIRKCFYSPVEGNVFTDLKRPMALDPIGNNCSKPNCALLFSFFGMGVIPDVKMPTYLKMLDRKRLFSNEMRQIMDFKFSDYQKEYSQKEQKRINKKIKKKFIELKYINDFTLGKLSLKNKIRIKIYLYLKNLLQEKGLIND